MKIKTWWLIVLLTISAYAEESSECDPSWRVLNPQATALEYSDWCLEQEPEPPTICHADANHDGSVDFQDLNIMRQEFFRTDCVPTRYSNVSWATPTEDAAGNPLTDLAGFKLYYGTSSGVYSITIDIADPAATNQIIGLAPGTYYIVITAYDTTGNESAMSNEEIVEIE